MTNNVCVIMAVYNGDKAEHLFDSLESMFEQSHAVDVFLGVDGPINCELQNVIDNFRNLFLTRLTVLENDENCGLAKTLNRLIGVVIEKNYQFIARMDSDDISHLDRIKKQVEYFNENASVEVLGTGCREFSSIEPDVYLIKTLAASNLVLRRNIVKRSPFIHPTVVFRRSVFESGLRYPTSNHLSEDIYFWVLLSQNGFHFANLEEPLLDFRFDTETLERRGGLEKGLSESKARVRAIIEIKEVPFSHVFYILAHFLLRISPVLLVRLLYKKLRK